MTRPSQFPLMAGAGSPVSRAGAGHEVRPRKKRTKQGIPCMCPDGIVRRATVKTAPAVDDFTRARISIRVGDGVVAITGNLRPAPDTEPQFQFIPWECGKNAKVFLKDHP